MAKTTLLSAPISPRKNYLGISYHLGRLLFWFAIIVCRKKKNPKPITIHSIYFKYASNFMFMWILLNVILVCLWRRYILQVHRETENSICLIFLNLIYFFKINLHAPLCNTCDLDQFFSFGFKNITAGSDSTDKYSLRGWSVPSSSL